MATAGIIPRLAPGLLSIYGRGSIYGFSGQSAGLTFGVINSMSQQNSGAYGVGQNVLFPYANAMSVNYSGVQYFLVPESEIVLIEEAPDEPELS